jgi:hypothetical protein
MFSVAELADERFLAQGIAIHCYFEELPASPRPSVAGFELATIELSNRRTELASFISIGVDARSCMHRSAWATCRPADLSLRVVRFRFASCLTASVR